MIRKVRKNELLHIEQFLKTKEPVSLTILPIIKCEIYHKYIGDIFVEDSDPTLFIFATKIRDEGRSCNVFWDTERLSNEEVKKRLKSIPDWSWDGLIILCGVFDLFFEQLDAMILGNQLGTMKMRRRDKDNCFLLMKKEFPPTEISLPEGFIIKQLKPCHTPFIFEHWQYSKGDSVSKHQRMIESFPSTGIFEKNSGTLVSWALTKVNGAIGIMYTLEKYRKMGLARAALSDLCYQLNEINFPSILNAVKANTAALSFYQKCGMEIMGTTHWVHYVSCSENQ